MMLELYTKENCIYCERAKKFFAEKGLTYTEKKLGVDFTANQLKDRLSVAYFERVTMPQVFKDGKALGGYEDIIKLIW